MKPIFFLLIIFLYSCSTYTPYWLYKKVEKSENYYQLNIWKAKSAFQFLIQTRTFESSHIGSSGSPSQGAIAFSTLLQESFAEEAFLEILNEGNIAGQLYALCGLYIVNRDSFNLKVQPFLVDSQYVTSFSGCVMSEEKVSEIVKSTKKAIQLSEGEELSDWYKKHKIMNWELLEPAEIYTFDIIGGAWSSNLKSVESSLFRNKPFIMNGNKTNVTRFIR